MKKISLHPAQRDIFSDQVINTKSSHYNISLCIEFEGLLDRKKLRNVVTASPQVFDVFKMRFDINETGFYGYIEEKFESAELFELDFSSLENPEEEAKELMRNKHNTPFDLKPENVPFQFYLIKISEDKHWFFFVFHHLVLDGFSLIIWVNSISLRYRSLLKDERISFSYPSYFDEIEKANKFYSSETYRESGRYWKSKFKEKPQPLLQKKETQAISRQTKSANYFVNISGATDKLLRELEAETRLSLQQLTTAALVIYFGKTTNNTEFTFGIPGHGRNTEEQKNMVGMFSNVLPFNTYYNADETLIELLESLRVSRREYQPHRNYLASDLSRSLDMSVTEGYLADIIINYVPVNFDLNYGDQVKTSILRVPSENERVPLQIFWRAYGKGQSLVLGMHYRFDYFNEREIELLSKRIIYILEQFPIALNNKIASVDIVPVEEKSIIKKFNDAVDESLSSETIVSAFEEQARRTPDLTAVCFENRSITYEELNSKANQLANYLIGKGIAKDTAVPICVERGIEMIVGIIGILKAGGAYVPIDPEYPKERIKFILQDIGATIILGSGYSKNKIAGTTPAELFLIDSDWDLISGQPTNNLEIHLNPGDLAYVIYTSGSTGKPKGVMITHKSYLNTNNCYYKISPGEQTILTCNFVFDGSVLEMLSSLLSGACLNIPPRQAVSSAPALAKYLYEKKISTAYVHPMFLEEVATALAQFGQCYLTRLLIAVEPVRGAAIKWYLDKGISVLNGYGPTEAAINATFFEVNKDENTHQILPIGKPIKNVQVFIVNNFELAPIGVTGEILIGGAGLARAYLNSPDITAEKFIENIFDCEPSSRLYISGDLARWLPDGNIEFIGRIDNQLKVRGHRIEPAEIEHTILQSGRVKQCVIVAKEYSVGDKRLVAYIVPDGIFDKENFVAGLKGKLPEYMVPVMWVEMESLPATTNGKIDRKALPEPGTLNIVTNGFIAPRNTLEMAMAAIWKKILRLEKVGINDNFFQIGGHSLLAVQLIALILKETGKNIQIGDLAKNPTIEKLANFIACAEEEKKYKYLTSVRSGGGNTPLYIVCGPGGTSLPFYKFAALLDPGQPVYTLQQPVTLAGETVYGVNSLEEVAAKYVEEISAENPNGPYALSGHCVGGIVALEMARQLKLKGREVKLLAMFDTIAPEEKQPDLLNYKTYVKTALGKAGLKLDFEMYLLKNHTRHAIYYKINSLNALVKKVLRTNKAQHGPDALVEKAEQEFKKFVSNYKLSNYDGDTLFFYAKDHYRFTDRNRNIFYKKFALTENTKNRWKNYAASAKIYEVAGDHLTIFDNDRSSEFAAILQGHLNECNR